MSYAYRWHDPGFANYCNAKPGSVETFDELMTHEVFGHCRIPPRPGMLHVRFVQVRDKTGTENLIFWQLIDRAVTCYFPLCYVDKALRLDLEEYILPPTVG